MTFHRGKQRTNLATLARTLQAAAAERLEQSAPPAAPPDPEPARPKQSKPAKREVNIGGSGAVDKQLRKKALAFIDFRRLLTC